MADKIRTDKTGSVAELTEKFSSSNATVLTEYRGLTVKQLTDLRRSLADLRAPLPDHHDLPAALARLAGEIRARSNLEVTCSATPSVRRCAMFPRCSPTVRRRCWSRRPRRTSPWPGSPPPTWSRPRSRSSSLIA